MDESIIGRYIYFKINGKILLKEKITAWGFVYDDRGTHVSVRFDKKAMKKLKKLFDKYPDMQWHVSSEDEYDESATVVPFKEEGGIV